MLSNSDYALIAAYGTTKKSIEDVKAGLIKGSLDNLQAQLSLLHDEIRKRDLQDKVNGNGAGMPAPNRVSIVSTETRKHGNLETRKSIWTAQELLNATFEQPKWIVEGLIPVGLTVLAGRPKAGKSYLALQIAGSVGSGGVVFGKQVNKESVLYIALEDNPQRLQKRMKEQVWDTASIVTFALEWPKLSSGGLEKIEEAVKESNHKLVIIDTLSRADDFKQKEVEESTNALHGLQRLAFDYDMAVVVIDHHKKPSLDINDVINDVLGSTGKTAVADNIIGLYRQQGEQRAELKAVSRDQDFVDLTIEMAMNIMTWQLVGNTSDVASKTRHQEILDALQLLGQATHTELVSHTGIHKGTLSKDLRALVEQQKVELDKSYYKLVS